MDKVLELLLFLMPEQIAKDLVAQGDLEFIASQTRIYLESDKDGKADIEAFHDCDGVRRMRQSQQKFDDGTPTQDDLEEWLRGNL